MLYVCLYVYEDSNFGGFRIPHVYVYAHKWLALNIKASNTAGALITPPARRAWRSYKFASLDFSVFFFGVRSWAAAHG